MADRTYIALIEPDASGYSVFFPDLPGCVSGGDDLDHAVAMAKEALGLHLAGMVEDGEPLPAPRTLEQIAQEEDLPDRPVYAAITVDDPDKAERVNVYLPKALLAQIERFGARTGIDNRSTFLRLAARQYLAANPPEPSEEEIRAALRDHVVRGGRRRGVVQRMAETQKEPRQP